MKNFFEGQKFLQGDVRIQNINIESQIGRGNSDVFIGKLGVEKIAIKQTQIKNDYEYHNFLQQIAILKKVSQMTDTIIHYEGYFISEYTNKSYGNKKFGYLLMERAQMNLTQFIKAKLTSKCRLSLKQINNAIRLMLNCFALLQSLNIAHCDIKPENILVTNIQEIKIKICDVGSCKVIDRESENQFTIKGTLSFLAPELVKIQQIKIASINPFRSDVYSFGLVLLYLFTGKKFTSQQRKQIEEQVYFQVINQWIQYAHQIFIQDSQLIDIIKKGLERSQFKRPTFTQLQILFQKYQKKRKLQFQKLIMQIKRQQRKQTEENQSIDTKKQTNISIKLPKLNSKLKKSSPTSSTLISFNSKQRLTGKISGKITKNAHSNSKDKSSNGKSSNKKISPFQKTTMYSTFSINKSKISIQTQSKKIIHITNQNYNMIPYENFKQQQKIFILYTYHIQFESAFSVIIKKQCSTEVFDKLCHIKNGHNLFVDYSGVQKFGVDQNAPTVSTFQSVFVNLDHSSLQGGYNNLLRCLCPIGLRNLCLNLTQSEITFQQLKMELQRLKNKQLSKLQLCWDKAFINYSQFSEINQKISKLPLRKLILSFSSVFLKSQPKFRWPLPSKCKILYLNFPNNFLSASVGCLALSISQLSQLKELYLNLQNNCLTDTDIKIIVKSLRNLKILQKSVLNFSWNAIINGFYSLEQLLQLNKITSLELRLSKCGINFEDISLIFGQLILLFNQNLKILKIAYDRKLTLKSLYSSLEKIIKKQIGQGLKLDIIGYDYTYCMIYVKKKSQPNQKSIKLKLKEQKSKYSNGKIKSSNNIDDSMGFSSNKILAPSDSLTMLSMLKQDEDILQNAINAKQENHGKDKENNKVCESLYTAHPTYECYICLGCIENKQMAKYEYFCRACIQNCFHKGHHIVRTYQKRVCNCPYNYQCCYRAQQVNHSEFICAQKLNIQYKKQHQCLKCEIKSRCEGCIVLCKQNHPKWVIDKPSRYFYCSAAQNKTQQFLNTSSSQQNNK